MVSFGSGRPSSHLNGSLIMWVAVPKTCLLEMKALPIGANVFQHFIDTHGTPEEKLRLITELACP